MERATRSVIVTGGNAGLGYECARSLLTSDPSWHVILACRSPERAAAAVETLVAQTGHRAVEAMALDLASLASIRAFARAFTARRELPPLHGLVLNAGLQVVSGTTHTQDGFETTFGVNHLGHFLLTHLLLDTMEAPGRIVFVSSGTHDPAQATGIAPPRMTDARRLAYPDPDAPDDHPRLTGEWRYSTSKLCNVYCAYEFARRMRASGRSTDDHPITVNAFDPGMMPGTGLARDYNALMRFGWRFVLPVLRFFARNVHSSETSGAALAHLLSDPQLAGVTGKYFEGRREIPSSVASYDEAIAAALWRDSAALVRLGPEETALELSA